MVMTSVFKRIPAHALALALAIGKHVAMSDHYRNRQETENISLLSESAYFTLLVSDELCQRESAVIS